MRTCLCIWLMTIASLCQAQPIDVLLVGTVHHFKPAYQSLQNFEQIQQQLIAYQPDIICIEAIPIDDSLSLKEILPSLLKQADQLNDSLPPAKRSTSPYPSSAFDSPAYWNTHKPEDLIAQGLNYYTSYDFWNAYYYWNTVEIHGDSLGNLSKYQRALANTEYGLIVFPVARQLGIHFFHNIDYRYQESNFLTQQNKSIKQLLFNFKWKPLGKYMKLQKKYKKAEKAGTLLHFINEPSFQTAFSNLIEDLPNKLKKSEEARYVKEYWNNRNKIMAQRIYQSALDAKATKVLVTVGSAHVSHIKRYLEELGCEVSTFTALDKEEHD